MPIESYEVFEEGNTETLRVVLDIKDKKSAVNKARELSKESPNKFRVCKNTTVWTSAGCSQASVTLGYCQEGSWIQKVPQVSCMKYELQTGD